MCNFCAGFEPIISAYCGLRTVYKFCTDRYSFFFGNKLKIIPRWRPRELEDPLNPVTDKHYFRSLESEILEN